MIKFRRGRALSWDRKGNRLKYRRKREKDKTGWIEKGWIALKEEVMIDFKYHAKGHLGARAE